jgi:hypothetical protein
MISIPSAEILFLRDKKTMILRVVRGECIDQGLRAQHRTNIIDNSLLQHQNGQKCEVGFASNI